MPSSKTGCQSFISHSEKAGLMLGCHEAASGAGKRPFSHINVSSLLIALRFQQLQPCPAALAPADHSYLQPGLLRMPLASAGIACATHRQKADNSACPHCLVFATLSLPEKGKNTPLETPLCFIQLQHSIFALSLCSSLFFFSFFSPI